jgi:hypothetical protein
MKDVVSARQKVPVKSAGKARKRENEEVEEDDEKCVVERRREAGSVRSK